MAAVGVFFQFGFVTFGEIYDAVGEFPGGDYFLEAEEMAALVRHDVEEEHGVFGEAAGALASDGGAGGDFLVAHLTAVFVY